MDKSNHKIKIYNRLLFVLPMLWMWVIYHFSAMNGRQSSSLSNPISGRMLAIVQKLCNGFTTEQYMQIANILEVIVRKSAHMTEYAILFVLLYIAIRYNISNITHRRISAASIMLCVIYASSDELHQLFVSARSGRAEDVIIDTCGVLIACVVVSLAKKFAFSEK